MMPGADPGLRGGKRLDLALGLNLMGKEGRLKGHRLTFEVGMPVYQSLDGPQLETDWLVRAGWQYAW